MNTINKHCARGLPRVDAYKHATSLYNQYKLCSISLRNSLQPSAISSVLVQTFSSQPQSINGLTTVFLDTLNPHPALNVRCQVPSAVCNLETLAPIEELAGPSMLNSVCKNSKWKNVFKFRIHLFHHPVVCACVEDYKLWSFSLCNSITCDVCRPIYCEQAHRIASYRGTPCIRRSWGGGGSAHSSRTFAGGGGVPAHTISNNVTIRQTQQVNDNSQISS